MHQGVLGFLCTRAVAKASMEGSQGMSHQDVHACITSHHGAGASPRTRACLAMHLDRRASPIPRTGMYQHTRMHAPPHQGHACRKNACASASPHI